MSRGLGRKRLLWVMLGSKRGERGERGDFRKNGKIQRVRERHNGARSNLC